MERLVHENDPEIDLYTASFLGELTTLQKLILSKRIKKCISNKNGEGWTPLMYACFNSCKPVVDYLVTQSANKKTLNKKKQSAFMIAALQDDTSILELVHVKEFINNVDSQGNSPLYYAILYGCNKSVRWLLKQNADVNHIEKDSGDSLLMMAVKNSQQDIVKLLLKYKPNLEIINKNGESAMSVAIKLGFYETAMLIQAHKGGKNLHKVLENLSLEKYWPLMEKNNIDLSKFLKMNEEDLKNIGIKLLGPRRKMSVVISEMNAQLTQSIHNYIDNNCSNTLNQT